MICQNPLMSRATIGGAIGGKSDGCGIRDTHISRASRDGFNAAKSIVASCASKHQIATIIDGHSRRAFHIKGG